MSAKLSTVGITSIGACPNNQKYVELSTEEEEKIFEEVKQELEVEKVANVTKDSVKDLLLEEKRDEEIENYKENEINWIDDPFWISAGWDGIKGKMKKAWGHKREYVEENKTKWFFLAHSGDTIKGKPQLVFQTMQRIPLFRKAIKNEEEIEKDEKGNIILNDKGKPKKTGNEIEIQSFYAFDESFDKRHDGFQKEAYAMDFWIYKIKTPEGKEVFIWSQKQLPNCTCEFTGMQVELEDTTELSRNMKVKSIGRIFFMKDFIPDIKLLTKEQLVQFTKERGITEDGWLDFLATHPLGTMNRFPKDTELLKSAQLLSGKFDGYPLHLFVWGPAGSRKSMGYIETTAYKFEGEEFK